MSVTGYSVQHDFEVQEYNQRRAAYKASEKKRKQEEKFLRQQEKATRQGALHQAADLGISTKHRWLLRLKGSNRKQQSHKPAPEVKFDGGYDSDELTLTEVLTAGK